MGLTQVMGQYSSWGVRNDTQKLLCFASTLASPGEDITTPGEPASVHSHGALLGPISSCNQPRMPPEKTKQENKLINQTQQIPTDCALGGKSPP